MAVSSDISIESASDQRLGDALLGAVYSTKTAVLGALGPCKFGSVMTRLPFNGAANITGANFTIETAFSIESDFDWIRFVYLNHDTAGHTITSACVAASSTMNDGVNPTNALGVADNTLWQFVTFNNAGALGDIPSPAGGTRTLAIPAATQGAIAANASDRIEQLMVSDWIMVPSLARLDGGVFPLVFCRTFAANGFPCPVGSNLPLTSPLGGSLYDSVAQGRLIRTYATNGDVATAPGTIVAAAQGFIAPAGIQYMSRKRGLSVLVPGDSLSQALGTATQQNDPYHMAAYALSTPGRPVSVSKIAYQGMGTVASQANGHAAIKVLNPDVVFIRCESPNDTNIAGIPVSVLFQQSLARAFAECEYCTRQGSLPVLVTPPPFNYPANSATELARQMICTAIRASNWIVQDSDAALADPVSPNNVRAAYTSLTLSPHYNDAGSAAICGLPNVGVQAVMQRILDKLPH